MSSTLLLSLPTNETWTTEQFLVEARTTSEQGAQVLKSCSIKAEDAVKELILLLHNTACLPVIHATDNEEAIRAKRGVSLRVRESLQLLYNFYL